MKLLRMAFAAALFGSTSSIAHTPVDTPYANRGECEAQLAADNIFHAQDKVSDGTYDNIADAMADMHDHFWCERNPSDGFWYMLRTPF
jgi:hypothetical protein